MKHRVDELGGALLDAAVAIATGLRFDRIHIDGRTEDFHPSTNWAHGGPLIEREIIELMHVCKDRWAATDADNDTQFGPTLLVAAMRCFVASKLGDEVELP